MGWGHWRTIRELLAVLGLALALAALTSQAAHAATFAVDSTADEPDATPGDGACASIPSGDCTLRAAAMEANALAGDDAITLPAGTFNLTILPVGGGVPDDEAHEDLDLLSNMTITGAGQDQTIVFASNFADLFRNRRTFEIHPGASVALAGLTIRRTGGMQGSEYTGIENDGTLTLTDVTVTGNMGLGIGNGSTGNLTVTRVKLLDIRPCCTFFDRLGAAALSNEGTATLVDVAVTGSASFHGNGAAVANRGTMTMSRALIAQNQNVGFVNDGTATLANVTVSGNSGTNLDVRGIKSRGELTLTNVTITANHGQGRPGLSVSGGTARIQNTIVARNVGLSTDRECEGSGIVSIGGNIQGDESCGLSGPGDLTVVDPKLGPLADNGGFSQTHKPVAGSPAIDAGTNSGCPLTDQRGQPRPVDGDSNGTATCDTGAVEIQRAYPTIQSFVINDGQLGTNSTNVTLTIAASASATEVSFTNDAALALVWQPFETQTSWTLTPGEGTKSVWATVRDSDGNQSLMAFDTIALDTSAGAGEVVVNAGAAATGSLNVTLTLEAGDVSGVAEMSFSNTNDGDDWSAWEPFAASKAWSLSAGAEGSRTVFARIKDGAGNVSPTFSDTIQYETSPPSVTSFTINGGALSTTTPAVNLAIQASDPAGGSGITQMVFSNDGGATWSAWEPFATAKAWSITPGDGQKSVRARVIDGASNLSTAAVAQITLDGSRGVNYGVSINGGAAFTDSVTVTLSIPAPAGTTQMQVSNDGGFGGAPWEPFATQKPWQISSVGAYIIPRTVYVRFKDAAGSVVPSTFLDDIILDVTAPTGSIQISGTSGQVAAASPTRIVQLAASDDLTPTQQIQMRLSNRADFAGAIWKPFTASATWDFTGGGTVYAQFKDGAGNVSQRYEQSLPGVPGPGTSPSPACSPRPRVNVGLQKVNGTLRATLSTTGTNNGIRAVRFDTFTTAIVDVGDQVNQAAPFAVSIPAGKEPTTLQFTIRRQSNTEAATVRLVVIDGCGEWSTLLGGGVNAW